MCTRCLPQNLLHTLLPTHARARPSTRAELDFLHEAQNSARCAANLDSKRSRVRGRVAVGVALPPRKLHILALALHPVYMLGAGRPPAPLHHRFTCASVLRRCRRWTWGAPVTG